MEQSTLIILPPTLPVTPSLLSSTLAEVEGMQKHVLFPRAMLKKITEMAPEVTSGLLNDLVIAGKFLGFIPRLDITNENTSSTSLGMGTGFSFPRSAKLKKNSGCVLWEQLQLGVIYFICLIQKKILHSFVRYPERRWISRRKELTAIPKSVAAREITYKLPYERVIVWKKSAEAYELSPLARGYSPEIDLARTLLINCLDRVKCVQTRTRASLSVFKPNLHSLSAS
ncbi:hypothetical protein BaRGS_00007114 [Batillaria attramentaria]|uniref:Uncharacterized protein n=1 Tax=Batillaria attramentaria TaxID=370345 RepID=A0ABD0LQE6_9CAEN